MAFITIITKFTVLEVVLGYVHYDESLFNCVNYIVLMGNQCIKGWKKDPLFKLILAFPEK